MEPNGRHEALLKFFVTFVILELLKQNIKKVTNICARKHSLFLRNQCSSSSAYIIHTHIDTHMYSYAVLEGLLKKISFLEVFNQDSEN